MNAVLIGYGEVGKGLFEALSTNHFIDIHDPDRGLIAAESTYHLMLVAIPYSKDFIDQIKAYQMDFKPEAVVIFSSVPIGTSRQCGALHSPIEGKHDNMAESICRHTRWFGGKDTAGLVWKFFQQAGLNIQQVREPETTEFLKLASTTIYGINIEWARYCKAIADDLGFDFNLVKKYNHDYNWLVQAVHKNPDLVRYNLDPPEGVIGGHCVLPNARLLEEQYPSPLLTALLEANEE